MSIVDPRLHEVTLALGAELLVQRPACCRATPTKARALENTLDRRQRRRALPAHGGGARRADGFYRTIHRSICHGRPSSVRSFVRRNRHRASIDTRALGLAVIELGGGRRVAADTHRSCGRPDAARRQGAAWLTRTRRSPWSTPRDEAGFEAGRGDGARGLSCWWHAGKSAPRPRASHRWTRPMSRAFLLDPRLLRHRRRARCRARSATKGANTLGHIAEDMPR